MSNFLITDPNSNFITFGDSFNVAEKVVDVASILQTTLPDFIKEDYPKFVAFIEAYYEWMEQQNQAIFESKKILVNQDIDTTIDEFVEFFKKEFMVSIPENILSDKRNLIKNIKQFYRARGTEKSFSLLFRLLFNKEVEFYYPREDVLKPDDGKWVQEKSIKVWVVSGDPFLLASREIKGDSTGAVAVVETVVKYSLSSYDVYELFLAPQSLYGKFIVDETITTSIPDVGDVVCRIYPVLTGVNIKQDTVRRNLWTYSEPLNGTSYTTTTGLTFQSASVLSVSGGEAVFGDNSTGRVLRKIPSPALTIGQPYTLSFLIKMNDGSKPNQGSGSYRDFTLTINNSDVINYNNIKYDEQEDGSYRVRYTYTYSGASTSIYIQKYSGLNSAIGFKASAFQLEQSSDISAYQKVDASYTPSILGGLDYDSNTEVFIRDPLGSGAKARIKNINDSGTVKYVEILNSGVGYSSSADIEFPIKVGQAYAEPIIGSVFTYPGYFLDEDGQLETTKFIEDSYFYQQYSYVLLVDESINQYREILKQILHPCGLIMFGGVRFVDLKVTDLHILNGSDGHSTYTLLFNLFADARKDLDDAFVYSSVRKNLLDYTEQFENAYWSKSRCNILTDVVEDPFGNLKAEKWVQDNNTGDHDLRRLMSFTSGLQYGISCYFKKAEMQFAQISTFGTATGLKGATVNLNTGAWANMGSGYGAFSSVSVESTLNGYYRLKVTFTALATNTGTISLGGVQSSGGTPSWVGDNTSGIYISGAQLEQKSLVTSYERITNNVYVPTTTSFTKEFYTRIITPQKDPNSFGFGPSLRSIERDKRNYLPSPIKHPTENALVPAPNLNYWQYGNMQIKDLFKYKLSDLFSNQKKKIEYHPEPYLKFENSDQLLLGYGNISKAGDFNFDASRDATNFEVSDIKGLILWLDGADPTTMYDATVSGSLVAVDGKIARWEDKSGNGFHATQATSANRPTRKVNVRNGLGSPFFDRKSATSASGANFMSLGTTIGKPSEFTIFTVAQRLTPASCSTLCFSSGAITQWGLLGHGISSSGVDSNKIRSGSSDGTGRVTSDTDGLTVDLTQYVIVSCRYTNGSNFVEMFVNGVSLTVTKTEATSYLNGGTLAEGSLGRSGFFDSGYFGGYISEAIVYNRALSNNEMQYVHAKLSQKWAVANISYPGTSLDLYPYSPKDITNVSAWYDFGDNQTLYDSTAGGLQQVGGLGVARVNDKSGNAYNLTQTTSGARPFKTIEPVNGRRNLWSYSEPVASTGYTAVGMTFQISTVIGSSRGEAVFGDASVERRLQLTPATVSGKSYILSFKIKMDDNSVPNSIGGTYKDFTLLLNNSDINTGMTFTHLGNNIYQCYRIYTANSFPNVAIRKYAGLNSNTGFKVSEIQLEETPANNLPSSYQKVITPYEITEVGQKHREGLFFIPGSSQFLIGDGVAPVFQGDDVPFTIISVEKPTSNTNRAIWSSGRGADGDYYNELYYGSSGNVKGSSRRSVTTTQTVLGTVPILLQPQITTYVFNGTTSSLYTNGIEDWIRTSQDSTTMSTNPNQFTVGALRRSTVSDYFDGNMYELIVLNKAITETERLYLEAYLAKKWNISNVFHPETQNILPSDFEGLVRWYDGLDESSFYDATSGGNVVTGVNDIARWEDKSGNAGHATQSDSGKRPNRFIEPITGRRNLLGITFQHSDATWGQNGTVTVTNNATTAPDGSSSASRINATVTGSGIFGGSGFDIPLNAIAIGQAYTVSAYFKANAGTNIVRMGFSGTAFATGQPYVDFNISTGVISYNGTQAFGATITLDQNGYYRCSFNSLTVATGAFSVYYYSSGGACDWYIWGNQLELGTVLTAYQRVSGRFNITERNVKNTYGIYCDGVDEFLDAGTISKPANWSIIIVGSKDTGVTGARAIIGSGDASGTDPSLWGAIMKDGTNHNQIKVEYGDGTTYSLSGTTSLTSLLDERYTMISTIFTSGIADPKIYANGTQFSTTHINGTATTTNGSSVKTSIGRLGEFNGFYWQGRVKEVLIFNRTLTETERFKLEYYLYKKWNLPNTVYSSGTFSPTKILKVSDAVANRSSIPFATSNTNHENLIVSSEDLTHSHIYKNTVTVSNSSVLSYTGTPQTISTITETANFGQKYIECAEIKTIANEVYTLDFYTKVGTKDLLRVSIDSNYCDINLTTKTSTNSGMIGTFPDLPSVGSWIPVRVTYTAPSNGNKALRMSFIEPRSNLLTYTEQFDNAIWLKNGVTVGTNIIEGPDGLLSADTLMETATTSQHQLYQLSIPVISGNNYTFSAYMKKRDKNFMQLTASGGFSTWHVNVNIDIGSITTSSGVVSSTLDTLANGWYKLNVTVTATSTTTTAFVFAHISNGTDVRIPTFTGNASQGTYIFGASVTLETQTRYQKIVSGSEINVDSYFGTVSSNLLLNRLHFRRQGTSIEYKQTTGNQYLSGFRNKSVGYFTGKHNIQTFHPISKYITNNVSTSYLVFEPYELSGTIVEDINTKYKISISGSNLVVALDDGTVKTISKAITNGRKHILSVKHTGGVMTVSVNGGHDITLSVGNINSITGKVIIGNGFIGKIGRYVTMKTIPTALEERRVFDYFTSIFGI